MDTFYAMRIFVPVIETGSFNGSQSTDVDNVRKCLASGVKARDTLKSAVAASHNKEARIDGVRKTKDT
ncbi:hypothetical protein PSAC2689_100196 [Paraburkholderia sacchari]